MLRRFLRLRQQADVLQELLVGGIDSEEPPAGVIVPDLLCPVKDGHRLAIGHALQHTCLVEGLDEPEGQQGGQEVAELAPDDGVVIVGSGLVKAAGRLVITHDDLDFPALRIGLVDNLRGKAQVALKDDGSKG